jgi:hypothetical protein
MKTLGILVACLVLSSCASPQVTMPAGVASLMYAQARADYATASFLVSQGCKAGTLLPDACERAKQIDVRVQTYRQSIEAALMNPAQPVDWAQVLKMAEGVSTLLLGLGVLP